MFDFWREAKRLYDSEPLWKRVLLFVPWILLLILGLIVWITWSTADKTEGLLKARREEHERKQADIEAEKKGLKDELDTLERERDLSQEHTEAELDRVDHAMDCGDWDHLDIIINGVRTKPGDK